MARLCIGGWAGLGLLAVATAVGLAADRGPEAESQVAMAGLRSLEVAPSLHAALDKGVSDLKVPLALMRICYNRITAVKDYTGLFLREERIGNSMEEVNYIRLKIRHEPFSVFMKWVPPGPGAGREVLYVDGWNNGRVAIHDASVFGKFFKRVDLAPDSPLLRSKSRRPINQAGLLVLTRRLRDSWEYEVNRNDSKVSSGTTTVHDRPCWFIQVIHPSDHGKFAKVNGGPYEFYKLCCYVDKQHLVPIRIEGYDWPTQASRHSWDLLGLLPARKAAPEGELVSRYTYLELKFDVGLTEADFDPANPEYHFQ